MAAGFFSVLKKEGLNVEQVMEYAKDLVFEESMRKLSNQIYVFGKQLHRMTRLTGKVDVIVTDCPLLLSHIYDVSGSKAFEDLIFEEFNRFNNVNFLIERSTKYEPKGRNQDESGARAVDEKILRMLGDHGVRYKTIGVDAPMRAILDYMYAEK